MSALNTSSSHHKRPADTSPQKQGVAYTSSFEPAIPSPRNSSFNFDVAAEADGEGLKPRGTTSPAGRMSSKGQIASGSGFREHVDTDGFPHTPTQHSDERRRSIVTESDYLNAPPMSPIGVHNVNININGVPYPYEGLQAQQGATSSLRQNGGIVLEGRGMNGYLPGSEIRRGSGSSPIEPLRESDFSPVSTTFPSRITHSTRHHPGGDLPSHALKRSSSGRFLLYNPLAIPLSKPWIRASSTLIFWLLAFYGLSRYVLPTHVHETIHLTISSFNPLRSSNNHSKSMSTSELSSLSSSYRLTPHFPPPPSRPADTYPSPDHLHRAFKPLDGPPSPFPRLRRTKMLPRRCLEGWFLNGEMMCSRQELGEEEMLDVTWLWVNGSDTRWKQDLHKWREGQGVISPDHHFRENNELKYSIRSVIAALPGRLRTFHLILADSAFDTNIDLELVPRRAVRELEALAAQEPSPVDKWTKSGKATEKALDGIKKRGELTAGWIEHHIRDVPADHLIHAGQKNSRAKIELEPPVVSDRLRRWLDSVWRVVQTPAWLNFELVDLGNPSHPLHKLYAPQNSLSSRTHVNSHPSLRYASHWEIFHTPTHAKRKGQQDEAIRASAWREQQWKEKALPTFNSMSIESRIGWLWGLADVSLSMNDDFFLLREHAVSDFYSPLYGAVIRFDNNYQSQVRPVLDKSQITDPGESGGLFHANWLLSQRFPRRLRQYFAHVPKVITRGLHHEASIMFEAAFTKSSQRKFREERTGDGDIQMQWLLTSLRVERWREALLWSWIVGRVGTAARWMAEERGDRYDGPVDFWGDDARADVRALFGLSERDHDVVKIEVHKGERWTLEKERMTGVFDNANWDAPKASEMLFSSLDGHLPPLLKPIYAKDGNDRCLFDLDRCFGSFWSRQEEVSSDEMFKRLAFVNPACGDCLIMALVTSSGPLGLSSVFAPESATFKNEATESRHTEGYLPPPHLPMTPTWAEADFSLANVLAETSLPGETVELRLWCMQLLSRYLYMSAKSDSHFHMLVGDRHADGVFKLLDSNRHVSILGMNDDIATNYEMTRDLMLRWFESRWSKPAVWEKGWTIEMEQEVNDLL